MITQTSFLDNQDWNFNNQHNSNNFSIHPYPAKFISELPRTLINNLEIPQGTAILDPFCGSGTTLLEAQKQGIPSMGIDLNPIACLISKTFTTKISTNLIKTSVNCVERAKRNMSDELIDIPNIDHWFRKDIQIALLSLKKEIFKITNLSIRMALKVAFSSIVVRVSNQESDTRYAAIEKKLVQLDVFQLFLNSIKQIEKNNMQNRKYFDTPTQIIEANVLELKPEKLKWKVGLVITSPPYPNA